MNRRCLNCMYIFQVPAGCENQNCICPNCGYVENTPAKKENFLNPGFTLNDRYIIGTVIGDGGFGITYRAWDNTLENMVAIKEYFPRGSASRKDDQSVVVFSTAESTSFEHGKDRFLKEARSLVKFNSNPGTVAIYDFFEANGTAYIIMEYLDGCNMKQYINANRKPLEFDVLLSLADSICDVLTDVHGIGLIHRDISTDNIFLCKDGTFKLIDFGAVKQSQMNDKDKSATVILKHGYAPVEQYSKDGVIGPWTDIYALAATLYILSTGKLPPEAVNRTMRDDLVNPRRLNPSLPDYFCNALMTALQIKPENRFQDARTFKEALRGNIPAGNMPIAGNNAYMGNAQAGSNSSYQPAMQYNTMSGGGVQNNVSQNMGSQGNNSGNGVGNAAGQGNKQISSKVIIIVAAVALVIFGGGLTLILDKVISDRKAPTTEAVTESTTEVASETTEATTEKASEEQTTEVASSEDATETTTSGEEETTTEDPIKASEELAELSRTMNGYMKEDSEATYKLGDTWVVDNNWEVTIDSVKETDKRDPEDNPKAYDEAVYVVEYTYKNLGYVDQNGIMDGLYIVIDWYTEDCKGEGGTNYYLEDEHEYPKEIQEGEVCKAKTTISFANKGPFNLYLEEYDSEGNKHVVTYEVEP